MRMLFGQIALSFLHSPTIGRAAKDFIIAKPTPLCGSIGAFNKQQNGNDTRHNENEKAEPRRNKAATLTAAQAPHFTPDGTVTEPQDRLA